VAVEKRLGILDKDIPAVPPEMLRKTTRLAFIIDHVRRALVFLLFRAAVFAALAATSSAVGAAGAGSDRGALSAAGCRLATSASRFGRRPSG